MEINREKDFFSLETFIVYVLNLFVIYKSTEIYPAAFAGYSTNKTPEVEKFNTSPGD